MPLCRECGSLVVEIVVEPRRDWSRGRDFVRLKPGSEFHVCADGHRVCVVERPEEPDPLLVTMRRA